MQVVAKPPVPKLDFELMSFAVSAIGGCEDCLKAHAKVLRSGGLAAQGLHSAIRLASVVKAAGAVLV
jgi:alkyl hydroperoxide reductase subunit D